VGLFIEPSMDTVISILGVLEAGAAYLPISVEYPAERVRFMVHDSGAKALVTNVALIEPLADSLRVGVVHLSDALQAEGSSPCRRPEPSDLAYVLYTSGSTGTPKAVMVEHRNVVRLLATGQSIFDFGPADVWTLYHSYCFDFSVWEIFGALLSGGEVVVVPAPTRLHMSAFFDLLQAHRVTVLNQTPSVFYRLIQEALQRPADLSLRMVIFGGEALGPARLETWHNRFPGVRLVNM